MPDVPIIDDALLEIIAPDKQSRSVRITQSPFLIGRGSGNHLQLSDGRISRTAAAILIEDDYYIEDRGQRGGIFLGGKKIIKEPLHDGDIITFGLDDSSQLVFRTSPSSHTVDQLLSRIENITHSDSSPGGLSKINLLLEATMLLHSRLPLDAALGAMLDHAIAVTDAERGLLLEVDHSGTLRTGPSLGTASARAAFGLLGAYASSLVNGPGIFSLEAFSQAGFSDGFSVTGGPSNGYLIFSFFTSGMASTVCVDTTTALFACDPLGPAGAGIAVNGAVNPLPSVPFTFSEAIPFNGGSGGIDVTLTASAVCGTFSNPADAGATACTSISNFIDTARVTGYTIEDANGNPVSGTTVVFDSGTNYNDIPVDTPEPSSLTLIGTGIAALIWRRKSVFVAFGLSR
jgi:FHA domain/PEP-CTERM motif